MRNGRATKASYPTSAQKVKRVSVNY